MYFPAQGVDNADDLADQSKNQSDAAGDPAQDRDDADDAAAQLEQGQDQGLVGVEAAVFGVRLGHQGDQEHQRVQIGADAEDPVFLDVLRVITRRNRLVLLLILVLLLVIARLLVLLSSGIAVPQLVQNAIGKSSLCRNAGTPAQDIV